MTFGLLPFTYLLMLVPPPCHDVPVVMMCPVLLGADSVLDHYRTVLSYTIHLCPALLGADSGLCPIDRLSTLEIVSQLKMTVPCSTEG